MPALAIDSRTRDAARHGTVIGLAATICLSAAACTAESETPTPKVLADDDTRAPNAIRGVYPDDFRCESVAPLPDVAAALGVTVTLEPSPFASQFGTPEACIYVAAATADAGIAQWTFDIDCRPLALGDAGRLMASYAEHPEAEPQMIGHSGIDHRDAVLLFVDDDTPCYVRVSGPGRDLRLALGRLVAAGMTPRTAPSRVGR